MSFEKTVKNEKGEESVITLSEELPLNEENLSICAVRYLNIFDGHRAVTDA